ncbi:MAG: MBOAT family protein [Spirochaetales bacterium]|nr:MBOAT family protein [Leptospiraceae bacterium]MCP5481764.1 MBOAT family protein [Spirochaetales bacterium]
MNFTSFHFVAFFFVSLVLGHLLRRRGQRLFLLLASYYFYGVFEPWYLILILGSSLLDYSAAIGIEARRSLLDGINPVRIGFLERLLSLPGRRGWLWVSLSMNLALLGYFKYTNFGIEVVNDLSPYGDTLFSWPATHILLPIGISFYTFQSMSYTIDVYRGDLRARRNIVDFALYVAFFPQLVAGPIVRAQTFFQYLDNRLTVEHHDILVGLTRIAVGFLRKLVLADNMGVCVNTVFSNPAAYNPIDIWIASFGFGFQIYFDFAGYTDIARGVARLFGFEFDMNFNYPMVAANIRDHWQRWHISLTTWIRDYIFFPLGGSRISPLRTNINIVIIWFLTGIWHGAAYHYVAWGISQAVMLLVHKWYSGTRAHAWLNARGGLSYGIAARVFTMLTLYWGFIYFRAENMQVAHLMIFRGYGIQDIHAGLAALWQWLAADGSLDLAREALFGKPGESFAAVTQWSYAILLILFFVYEYTFAYLGLEYFWKPENRRKLILLLCGLIWSVLVFASPDAPGFLYFQF